MKNRAKLVKESLTGFNFNSSIIQIQRAAKQIAAEFGIKYEEIQNGAKLINYKHEAIAKTRKNRVLYDENATGNAVTHIITYEADEFGDFHVEGRDDVNYNNDAYEVFKTAEGAIQQLRWWVEGFNTEEDDY